MVLLNVPRDVERLLNEQPFVFVYRIYESRLTDPDPNLRGNIIAGESRHYDQLSPTGSGNKAMVSLHFLRKLKTLSPCRCICLN